MRTRTTVERPPGPGNLFRRGELFSARRDPLGFLMSVADRYGDISFFKGGPFEVYFLTHPDHVRDVLTTHHHRFMKGQGIQEMKRLLGEGLLTSEDPLHKRQRRLIQPMFHHSRISAYGDVMARYADDVANSWSDGEILDVHEQMMRLTLSIVGKCLFDTDIGDSAARRIRDALTAALDLFGKFQSFPFTDLLMRLPIPARRRFFEARESLDSIVFGMIRERHATGDRGDLLSTLLSVQDEERSGGMSDQQVRDEAMTILLAGHETTANALTWTWYLLSQHPNVERKLHDEIDGVLHDRLPSADDLPRLPYAERVLAEAMRLYPPAWVLGRKALDDHQVDGYVIPAGSLVLLSPYVVHHDARWFPDPYGFDPDRWTQEEQRSRPKHTYFPFGGGPRLCIGESFAWMEGILVMVTLARQWRMRLARGHPIGLQAAVTLRPKHGMRMAVERRNDR
ncbi:MAG: cytochrome P450 [Actinomycetota bacterium]|nr:cytochrome P450 [Actinomycetota bacterium]